MGADPGGDVGEVFEGGAGVEEVAGGVAVGDRVSGGVVVGLALEHANAVVELS